MTIATKSFLSLIIAAIFVSVPGTVRADGSADMATDITRIEHEWAHITYEVKNEDDQDNQMRALLDKTAAVVARFPRRAEPLIWEGVVASSEAKYAGMFASLSFAKQARDLFETAGRLDFRALGGAVPTSLGALYYMVPGFPIGFGDNDKARRYLEQGVSISPDGLDANYFYADFLFREGEYGKAEAALKRALATPPVRRRPVWDAGRRREMRDLLAKIGEKQAASR